MPVDFRLGQSEAAVRDAAAVFAREVLKPARAEYMAHREHHKRFQATRPVYSVAVANGLIKGQIPPALGGGGGSLIEAAILVEELYAVEPGAALTIFATGLGLTPLNLTQRPEHRDFLRPFLSGAGEPLASLVFSEPGGSANFIEKGAPGLMTTARKDGDEWVINGEKVWATNSAGWDFKGPELSCIVCRDVTNPGLAVEDPKENVMIILVTRDDIERNTEGCFQVLRHLSSAGHTAVSGPHIRYTDLRVGAKNVLCPPGEGASVVSMSFDCSAVLVGAMAVGLIRAAFDAAMEFAKNDNRRGSVALLERQAVADLLSGVKMKAEACRALTWKAAHALENGPGDYAARRELALAAKIYCSDTCVQAVNEAINAVGISAYDSDNAFADIASSAMVLPIFDGGNVGVRRRHMQEIMLSPTYDAWAATYGSSKTEKGLEVDSGNGGQ